ncbi:MAG TPA: patatin-like phospholipase family protein [Firmicutes bacterium]|nr:patatin-like phospholipase family protein [Bacillota bacterium]
MTGNLQVGLALGGGLARGLAHIGVLKVLLQEGIKVDYLAGTSMGSLIASLYACGLKLGLMEKLAKRISRRVWMDFTFPRMGLMAGDKLEQLVYLLTKKRSIEDLPLPLGIVATDITKGERAVIRTGSIAKAVRASCALPGIFNPVEIGGRLMVDGGVLERVPAQAVKEMGAEVVIAVDVGVYEEEYKIDSMLDVIFKTIDIMAREITRARELEADVLISPDLKDVAPFQFQLVEEAIDRGEQAAYQALPLVRSVLNH